MRFVYTNSIGRVSLLKLVGLWYDIWNEVFKLIWKFNNENNALIVFKGFLNCKILCDSSHPQWNTF